MAAWVLESAFRYAKAAALLEASGNLGGPSEVNAALALELMIKSLLVVPVENARKDTSAQQYTMPSSLKVGDGHDLYLLYKALPADLAQKVGLTSQEWLLEKKRHVFKRSRYVYEERAVTGHDPLLLRTVTWLFPQFIHHFVDSGDTDQWLLSMYRNPERISPQTLADPAK